MTKKNTIYYEKLCSLGELMDRQYNLYDEGLCNAENTLNYFKYLRENNKLEICGQYLLDITRYHLYAHRSKLYDILQI
ncbi:hypothetical protein JS61_05980 [Rickettsia felis]|uniref:hypothetical protein n=1 Tax=Rickettsia felis TaxID=42862 RepID=UPI000573BC2F|nr:hypothetical protein [Rickettsia felis]KHO03074.1 hypothetical protein JS61_05980 [Rickettsia felis]